jgi:SOS response associated peptidase (SRAP)/DinB superfamily
MRNGHFFGGLFFKRDGELFAFAGLWDGWKDSQGNWIKTCSILTTMPNAVAGIVHDRMPVILLVLFGATLTYSANCQDHQESAAKHATTEEEQAPKTVSESVAGPLRFVEASFVGLAEAVPEDKYGFIPTNGKFDGVRSFGEQIKHVACAQFAFFNEFEGKEPPADCEKGGLASTRTKAELIKYLKDSFDYGDRVIATLNEKNALDRVEGRYAGTDTKLGISVVALWYITDHYGQLVEYLRMNGVVPPMTQKYGLKVR